MQPGANETITFGVLATVSFSSSHRHPSVSDPTFFVSVNRSTPNYLLTLLWEMTLSELAYGVYHRLMLRGLERVLSELCRVVVIYDHKEIMPLETSLSSDIYSRLSALSPQSVW